MSDRVEANVTTGDREQTAGGRGRRRADPSAYLSTEACLLFQELDGTGSVREDLGGDRLVDGSDVVTVSLFRTEGALVWYLELTERWADPAATLRERSPVYGSALSERFDGPPRPSGRADPVVHAINPSRPVEPESVDVVLVDLGIEPGLGTRLGRALVGLMDWVRGTWLQQRLAESSGEMLEAERMWTESLFLDTAGERDTLRWYMEAEDMDRVLDVYEDSDARVARWSEAVLDRLLETPMDVLGDPMAASDYALLAHETTAENR